jgi:hypothetical protein
MASTIKVDTVQNQPGTNIVSKCGTTITLGQSGDTVSLASGASQTGFGRSGSVNWDTTVKTTGFTAVSGNGYFCNTTGGAFTVTLPSGPSAGDIVAIKDYANTFDTNNVTVGRNSSKIGSKEVDATLSEEGISVTLVYIDGTQGWLVTNSGLQSNAPTEEFVAATGGTITTVCTNYKVHTFTGPGTFQVTNAGNAQGSNTVSYLVIAGGGGGGRCRAGGGGAGGFREGKASSDCYTASPLNAPAGLPVSVQCYSIAVGGGGGGSSCRLNHGSCGVDSSFSTITAGKGGGGASDGATTGKNGGSGGAGANSQAGGSGNTPPVSPPQGNNGAPAVSGCGGGGGGGAGAAGGPMPSPTIAGTGGAGATTEINGSPVQRAAGGGGGSGAGAGAPGGAGGGGPGVGNGNPTGAGGDGTVNTGSAGGGTSQPGGTGGSGGSGIVIIRYKFQ